MMIFLAFEHPDVVLKDYLTQEVCQAERNRIGFEMAAAYPLEHSFDIVCRLKKVVI